MMMEKNTATALVVLRSDESKSLIGQAVAALSQVQNAKSSGRMIIVGGSTNRYVIKHLVAEDPGERAFPIGWIRDGKLGESDPEERGPGPFLFDQGQCSRGNPVPLLQNFESGDIFIKGANAIDHAGNIAVLLGSNTGGTIGAALAIVLARGGEIIVPVSLQKLIPSIPAVARLLGQDKVGRVMGSPVGYMPIIAGLATLVTEVTAMKTLFNVTATPVAAGGLADCAGSVTLHLAGSAVDVDNAWSAVASFH